MLRQPMRQWRYGRLRLALDFYVPFRLYRATCDDGRRVRELLLAIDAVTGQLDPYLFDEAPDGDALVKIETARTAPALVSEDQSRLLLTEKLKREAFLKGFFKLRQAKTGGEMIADFYLPYWIGVYERNERARPEVINAVHGRFEGVKLREIVTDWFLRQ